MKTYCLWGSCSIFESCKNLDYIVTDTPLCLMSLEEAKKKYPDALFCEDWKEDMVVALETKN